MLIIEEMYSSIYGLDFMKSVFNKYTKASQAHADQISKFYEVMCLSGHERNCFRSLPLIRTSIDSTTDWVGFFFSNFFLPGQCFLLHIDQITAQRPIFYG